MKKYSTGIFDFSQYSGGLWADAFSPRRSSVSEIMDRIYDGPSRDGENLRRDMSIAMSGEYDRQQKDKSSERTKSEFKKRDLTF